MNCPFGMTQCFDGCTRCHEGEPKTMYRKAQRGGKSGGPASTAARRKKKRAEKTSQNAWMKG